MTADNQEELVTLGRSVTALLRAETKRTGAGPRDLLEDGHKRPEGLTPRVINRLLLGTVPRLPKAQLDYIIARFAALPDKAVASTPEGYRPKSGRRVASSTGVWLPLTDEMVAELNRELHRTGLGSTSFLTACEDAPPGLNPSMITGWLKGRRRTVNPDLWHYTSERLKTLPDRATVPRRTAPPGWLRYNLPGFEKIGEADLAFFQVFRERTRLGVARFMRGADDRPSDLTDAMIAGWWNGQTTSAKPSHVAYVIERMRSLLASQGAPT